MSRFSLSPDARVALVDIYNYTIQTWSMQQADTYLNGLFARFEEIADRRVLWRPVPPDFGVDGYFTRYESHIIYWKELDTGDIGIVTVLHSAMMQGDRLQNAFGRTE